MTFLETVFVMITGLSLLVSVEMMVDIPGRDVPDVKDIGFLFPAYAETLP